MKYTIQLEIEIEDYASAHRFARDVSGPIPRDVIEGAQEWLAWRFGSTVQVRLSPGGPSYDPVEAVEGTTVPGRPAW